MIFFTFALLAVLPFGVYSNDDCLDAVAIPSVINANPLPYYVYADLTNATQDASDPLANCSYRDLGDIAIISRWYSWIPEASGVYTFMTKNLYQYVEAGLEIYEGTTCASSIKELVVWTCV
jgi:hypothetical protein